MLLAGLEGVRHVAAEGTTFEGEQILTAEVSSASADDALELLVRAGVAPGSIALSMSTPPPPLQIGSAGHWVGGDGDIPPWSEVVGEARAQARLVGRYLTLMVMAGIIAGVGVADRNIILVIGAMAISPELAADGRHVHRHRGAAAAARRAIITLAAGLAAAELAVLATATVLKLAGDLKSDLGDAGLGGLTHTDLTTVIIAVGRRRGRRAGLPGQGRVRGRRRHLGHHHPGRGVPRRGGSDRPRRRHARGRSACSSRTCCA